MTKAALAWSDHEREEGTLVKVERWEGGDYSVTSSNGWSCSITPEWLGDAPPPKVGDHFVTWGRSGWPFRGQALAGRVLWYRTPAEQEVVNAKDRERLKDERVAEYEGKRADFDRRVATLPEPMRKRVEAFRAHGGDAWRWSFETYEVMCCEEAVKIAAAIPDVEELRVFAVASYDEQKARFPAMSDGHSGNSWGASVMLARLLLENPSLLVQQHGALCPLAGCEDYGCYAARKGVTR